MEIAFDDDELEKLCSNAKYAARKLGAISAKKLQSRLADIVAAHNVTELVAGELSSNLVYGKLVMRPLCCFH